MSNSLFELIGTLSGSEKRYIHLSLKTFWSDSARTEQLEDFLNLEKNLEKKNGKELTLKTNITRLYYRILDVLYVFHESDLPNCGDTMQILKRAKVLLFKGRYKEGVALLDRVINNHSNYDYLHKMEALELRLESAIKFADVAYLNQTYATHRDLFTGLYKGYYNYKEYQNIEALIKLESTTGYFYESTNKLSGKYSVLLESEDNAIHPMAKIYFNKANAFLSIKSGDLESAFTYANRTLELFNQYPEIREGNVIIYLKSIRNLTIVLIHLKRYLEAENLLNSIEHHLTKYSKLKTIDIRTEVVTLNIVLRTDIIIANESYHVNSFRLKYFELEFKHNLEYLKDDEKCSMYYNLSVVNFKLGNYRQALKYNNQALKISGNVRKDIYHMALFNEFSIHYFLGNEDLFNSKLTAYKRFVTAKESYFGFELDLPSVLIKILNDPYNSANFNELYSLINKSLEEEGKVIYRNFITLLDLKTI